MVKQCDVVFFCKKARGIKTKAWKIYQIMKYLRWTFLKKCGHFVFCKVKFKRRFPCHWPINFNTEQLPVITGFREFSVITEFSGNSWLLLRSTNIHFWCHRSVLLLSFCHSLTSNSGNKLFSVLIKEFSNCMLPSLERFHFIRALFFD